ncbi:MAG: PASTA domain-containing protein, partial [Kofleriaceae bacterium]|nr:PASTA domain-containing protein [Kofleriaceae bacterium]
IEMPGEQTGRLRNGSSWRDIELATISFGYGLTITPLQLAAALAAIGNKGVYHAPRIVDEVVDSDGVVLYRGESEAKQMVSAKTAEQMRVMLARVFDKALVKEGHGPDSLAGTAQGIIVQGFKCGGKTGTAHKYDPAIKTYSLHHYLSSFAGLAPIDNPRLAIVVIVDDPVGGDYFGGKVAGPVFARVASESLRYLGVPGEAEIPLGPNGKPLPPPKPEKQAKPAKAPVQEAPPVIEEEPISEPDDPDAIDIPDFTGMGVGRALDEARKLHLEVDVTGSGQVIAQEPAPGKATGTTRVKLTFSVDARRISPP